MSLESAELKIGNTSFKGVYIAILLSLVTTISGGVWTASSVYSRLEAVEAYDIPEVEPLHEQIELIKQELTNNNVSQLQGKLAELGTNLLTIKSQQENLLDIKTKVNDLEKEIESMKGIVAKAEVVTGNLKEIENAQKRLSTEVEDLWKGLDYVTNPLSK